MLLVCSRQAGASLSPSEVSSWGGAHASQLLLWDGKGEEEQCDFKNGKSPLVFRVRAFPLHTSLCPPSPTAPANAHGESGA